MAATLPVFPLGTVLLPGAPLPLHIFEPRYRRLTVDLVTGAVPDKQFGVVAVREGFAPDDGLPALYRIGCTAELIDVRRLPDGRYDIITRGVSRFRLLHLDDAQKPYLVGSVEYLPDGPEEPEAGEPADGAATTPDDRIGLLSMAARAAHRRYCDTAWQQGDWKEPPADTTPATLPGVLAADCLLSMDDRQLLLEQTSPVQRLRLVRALLTRETALLARLRAVPAPLATFAVEHGPN